MNAKKEFLNFTKNKEVKCALINKAVLKKNYTNEEFNLFLKDLDFEYDSNYGTQELFGTIWFKDNSWAIRGKYDGSEWWQLCELPEIPKELQNEKT